MRIAVFSDTHGSNRAMATAVYETKPDAVIHLGDYEKDAKLLHKIFPDIPLYYVRGNCDYAPTAPVSMVVPLGRVRAFICHGHTYQVKSGYLDSLVYAAQEQDAQIALFGHTHTPHNEIIDGVRVVNPGSAGRGLYPGWAMIEIPDGSEQIDVQIIPFT